MEPMSSCLILDQRKSSELEQNCGISYRKTRGTGVPVVDLITESAKKFFFVWAMWTLTIEFDVHFVASLLRMLVVFRFLVIFHFV